MVTAGRDRNELIEFLCLGYLKITDLGIARAWKADNAAETSGTPGYMAPEVMCRQNHGFAVDYYALGVIAYECMLGRVAYEPHVPAHLNDSNPRDHTVGEIDGKSATKSLRNRFRSSPMRSQMAGHRKGLTS